MRETDQERIDEKENILTNGLTLPSFGIVMKIGPHLDLQLSEIIESKRIEEAQHGAHFWGYSGTLCHPKRVLNFIRYVELFQDNPPSILLIETKSKYNSKIGEIHRYSVDGQIFNKFTKPVQLQGAQYAFVCKDLRHVNTDFYLDQYSVIGGKNDGKPLSKHLRHRIGKAFIQQNQSTPSDKTKRLAYIAQIVEPFVLWLGE